MAHDTADSDGGALNVLVDRRRLLGGTVGAAVGLGLLGPAASGTAARARPLDQDAGPPSKPGSTNIVHSTNPPLEETRVSDLVGLLTPTAQFFIRNHSATPQIDVATWRLQVGGHVDRPYELTYDELRAIPRAAESVRLPRMRG